MGKPKRQRIPPIAYAGKKPLTPEQLRQADAYWRAFGGKDKKQWPTG